MALFIRSMQRLFVKRSKATSAVEYSAFGL
jgi:hypothetical protein